MTFINVIINRLLLSVTVAAAAPHLGTSVTHFILLLFNHLARSLASLPPRVLSSRLHPSTNVVEDANQDPAVTNQRTHSHLLSSGSARKHFSMLHHLCRAHMYDFSVICCWLLTWSKWNMIATCAHTQHTCAHASFLHHCFFFFMHVQNNQDSVKVNVNLRLLLFFKLPFIVFKCLFQWTCSTLRCPCPLKYNSSFHSRENLSRLWKGHLHCWTFHVRHSFELYGKNKRSRWKRKEAYYSSSHFLSVAKTWHF